MTKSSALIFVYFVFNIIIANAQAVSYSDPVQAYNKLLIEKNNGTYTLIGSFKVIGTPYFLGGGQYGNVYAKGETGNNVILNYNTFLQNLEIKSSSASSLIMKEFEMIDSFKLLVNNSDVLLNDCKFINPALLGSNEKSFFQILSEGKKYNLYKRYKTSLGIVSTNYVQADLREFDLNFDYFYYDFAAKQVRKLKSSGKAILHEFKGIKDLSSVLNDTSVAFNPDKVMLNVFIELNK